MESPDQRVDSYIEGIIEQALGAANAREREEIKTKVWHVIREHQEERSRQAAEEEQG